MKTTHFPGSLMQAVGYLRRHPRVRITHGACPDAAYEAEFRRGHGRIPGVSYGTLVFRAPDATVRLMIVGGDAVAVDGRPPVESGLRFEPGGFTVERGGAWTRVEYREGPAALAD